MESLPGVNTVSQKSPPDRARYVRSWVLAWGIPMGLLVAGVQYLGDYGFAMPPSLDSLVPYLAAFPVGPLGGYIAGQIAWRVGAHKE